MTITLPLLTVSEPNRREHWAKKANRAATQRAISKMACCGQFSARRMMVQCESAVRVSLSRVAPRALDDDNLRGALKAVRDGVADALGVADNDPRVTWDYAQRRGQPREYAVTITITRRGE